MDRFDLLVVGGGINGAAVARDAAGRGMKVLLVEKDDLASHTSSASSKLAHGGLRYLEQRRVRLVREALREREVLLRTAPHIVRPLRFVLPHAPGMRPLWLVRLGLLAYDLLALRGSLPRSRRVRRGEEAVRAPLIDGAGRPLLSYHDGWVDDARLVVLNAVDAAERGAEIATRTELLSARREGQAWRAELSGGRSVLAGAIVNAAGAWAGELLGRLGARASARLRLVKGSHIVVPPLYEGEHGCILQQPDGRVVFALPFEGRTLLGTTDVEVSSPADAQVTAAEAAYLCAAANFYFVRRTQPSDIVWRFAGIRALADDGAAEARAVTREHRLELDAAPGPKLLTIFGGKLTTARAVASEALDRLGAGGFKFTRTTPLPGGDVMPPFLDWLDGVAQWMPPALLTRLSRAYGTRLPDLVGDARSLRDLGRPYGAGLYEAEVRYLREKEFARTADDILHRRTKLALHMSRAERDALARALKSPLPLAGGG